MVSPTGYRGNPLRKEDMSEIMKYTNCGNHKRISGGFIETMRKLNLRLKEMVKRIKRLKVR